ncbi:DUF2231 domain-containing protein [Candidatus Uabimicrobium sp. HlEnr_7]|uniref:DUF2231 domain-containing protein n=1 Tax=Candidatus Uabimicrobium helgolandensis TaxID=3095367 RepID=UPI0035563092
MKKTTLVVIFISIFSIVVLFIANKKRNITNQMCPVMTAEKADPNIYYDYGGQRVYLCCKRCLKKFSTNPQKYMKNYQAQDIQIPKASFSSKLISFLGKLHPIAVHFPIALFFAALIAKALSAAYKKELQSTIYYCLNFAAVSSIIALVLGWCAYLSSVYKNELETVANIHKIMGTLTAILIMTTALFEMNNSKSKITWLFFITTALAIGVTGFLGTSLIFGLGHYNW